MFSMIDEASGWIDGKFREKFPNDLKHIPDMRKSLGGECLELKHVVFNKAGLKTLTVGTHTMIIPPILSKILSD